jgi:hypothetical protein
LRLIEDLQKRINFRPERVVLSIDENHGQRGVWEWTR